MRDSPHNKKVISVTTSWDDGHPLDRRLADLLSTYGIKGTFYVAPKNCTQPVLDRNDLLALSKQGMEIGSHTLSHAVITQIPIEEAREELVDSKSLLEDILGETVSAFCYPKGKFNKQISHLVRESGYRIGRTTVGFRTDSSYDPFVMPVGIQMFSHPRTVHVRHALKEGNFKGLRNWCLLWGGESDFQSLSRTMFDYVQSQGGIFHLWGHSWEIERSDLWVPLEKTLRYISNHAGVQYLTNSQLTSFSA